VPICLSRTWPWLCLSVLIFAVLASYQGSDANWDFRNYHLYNGEAVLGSRHGDIAVAQEQTYLNPALDIAYALLRRALSGSPALLLAAMAVPQGIAAFLAWRIAVTVIPDVVPYRKLLAALAVLFGATGAAGLPTLGTTMTEMVPACFMLSGLLVLMDRQPGARWRIAGAGLLFGAAVGLKLVIAPTLLGASAALLLTPDRTLRQRGKELVFFGAGGAAGLLLVAGPWWLDMYQHYGNPLFPYYNDVFRSPWVLPERLTDNRFKPKDWLHAVFYSFYWGAHEWAKVTEVRMRDPRFSMAYVAVIGLMALAALRRLGSPSALLPASNRAVFLAIFFAASFLVWEALFSIFRYLAPIELLTGTVVLLPLLLLGPLLRIRLAPHAALGGLFVVAVAWTVYPQWGRTTGPGAAVRVALPQLEDGSMVILLDPAPMGYLAAYAPRTVRFVGANNSIVKPGQTTLLAQQIETAIRTHTGPLWGVEASRDQTSKANATLAYYGLRRSGGCVQVRSNLDQDEARLCPLF
jgi:hypothetical protein